MRGAVGSNSEAGQTAESRPDGARPASTKPEPVTRRPAIAPAAIVTLSVVAIAGLSLWYAVQPQPLLVQGEADATRIDVAARVDGRVAERPIERGNNVAAGQLLVSIDNPQLLAKLREAQAAEAVAAADLTRIMVGTRPEIVAARKAALEASQADATLAQQTFGRTKQLAEKSFSSVQKLDEATRALDVAQRGVDQAKFAYDQAVNGYTAEERGVSRAGVAKAQAAVATLQAQVDELTVKAPATAQVYQIAVERGEYVSPGVPLLSLVDLGDVWIRFDLREDLVKGLKVGDRFKVKVPALGDRTIDIAVRTIATRGEYAGWRATRATGDFDLRTFEVRAYPVEAVPTLRPGMSAYTDWKGAR